MNERDDRVFADWLRDGPERGPGDGPARVFAVTRATPQRPAWTFLSRWTRAPWPEQRIVAPAVLLVVLALLLVAAATVVLVGGSRHRGAPLGGPAPNGIIAFDTGQGGQVFLPGPDGQPHPILGAETITRGPSFSHDGTKVIFWSRANTDQATLLDLYSADPDGSNVRRFASGVDGNVYFTPDWSPDGLHVVYYANDAGVDRLYVVPVDGSAPPVAITGRDASRSAPTWSPDGKWIAFHKLAPGPGGTSSFSIIRPDGSEERDLHSQPDPKDGGMDNGPLWAPDSSAIAYARLGDPAHPDESASHAYLVVMPIDAPAEPKAIYDEITGSMSWPGWSPDGTWLAVGLRDSAPSKGILVRPDGSSVTSFAVQGAVGAPECGFSFAPDGLSLVSGCEGFKRYWLSDLEHPDVLPLPSGAAGMSWQRGSAP